MIRLVIIDDHLVFREGVALTLAVESDLVVIGEGLSANDALLLAGDLTPDVLLLDLDIPGGGLSVIQAIGSVSPNTRIIILTASTNETHLLTALRVGAKGYVHKGVSARELATIIRTVQAGQGYVPPSLAAHLLTNGANSAAATPPIPTPTLSGLTEREHQILNLVADGLSNKQVASALHVTEKTIKNHMTDIMQKLQVRNRVEAALLAKRSMS